MTKKLFSSILSTCLLFGSLYLPAYADAANKTAPAEAGSPTRKSPEANFLDGDACLQQAKIACAKLVLASIPSTSTYAKLLQGSIALTENQTDKALLLLLPLQSADNLIPQAKIALHLYLAGAFETLDDVQQALQHFIKAESTISKTKVNDAQTSSATVQEKIWGLLGKLEQSELIALRGNNTDYVIQGWIDLRLAANNQDTNSSITDWSAIYPDHPAQAFSKNLFTAGTNQAVLPVDLASEGSIALIMPLTDETYAAKADAFKLGLETALTKHELHNEIKTYLSSDDQQNMDDMYTLAKNEGNAYFIIPSFDVSEVTDSKIQQVDAKNVLQIAPILNDEALHMANFALRRGMQQVTIIITDNEPSKLMSASFQAAWQSASHEQNGDAITVITLPDTITDTDNSLFELKPQLAEKTPDMIVLAMSAAEARSVRPHLPISTPTMTFSSANEAFDNAAAYHPLNAVRLFDIPYLLAADQATYKDYEITDANLYSNDLLRWFALGADSLQLLTIAQKLPEREVSFNGLTGTLTVDSSGNIKRQLPLASFTHSGVSVEQ